MQRRNKAKDEVIERNSMIPVQHPQLPQANQITPYLQRIDQSRWYTNFGELVQEFEERLANYLLLKKENIVSAANGTMMLTTILKALQLPEKSLCVMPSWTFVATAAAAYYANLIPYFVDVDIHTQALNPYYVKEQLKTCQKPIAAVIAVTPFGHPIDTEAWDEFTHDTGIPVIIDAAAGFDTINKQMQIRNNPVMISLHATKVFGIGEGGIVLSTNAALIRKIKSLTSFGFNREREACLLGYNAKLSEYAAAIGLAALDDWPRVREQWQAVHDHYIAHFKSKNIKHFLSDDWVGSTCNIVVPHQAEKMAKCLKIKGVDTRRWYHLGCHKQQAYQHFPQAGHLSNTQWLGESILGLPLAMDLKEETIAYIADSLVDVACLNG